MAAMTTMTSTNAMHELLDHSHLIETYQQAYRLLFARAMTDILKLNYTTVTSEATGARAQCTQVVTLKPVFTYLVEGLLGIVTVAVLALCYLDMTQRSKTKLIDDPRTSSACSRWFCSGNLNRFHFCCDFHDSRKHKPHEQIRRS